MEKEKKLLVMAPWQVFPLKDSDDTDYTFRNSFMWSLANVPRFLFVSKSSVCMYNKQIQTLKSISQLNSLSSQAKIKVYQVGNTHSVPSRFKCSGVVRYQKRWKWVRVFKRRVLADAKIHKQKVENTFDGWILIMTWLFSGRVRKYKQPA